MQSWRSYLKWLKPGLGVKRWLLFLVLGIGLLSLGTAIALRALYPLPQFFYFLTLQFLPRGLRAGVVVIMGVLQTDCRIQYSPSRRSSTITGAGDVGPRSL